ncbi:hypothetical protein BKH46_00855 [Helicobacter sp. 12S02634-8]|nr:hypothetical protein BKH46_00855 [Helicobacter sp. 12S02634-8]
MKESWELVELFEAERERFKQESQAYKQEIEQSKKTLKDLRAQITQLKAIIKKFEDIQSQKIEAIKQVNQELFKYKIKKNISALHYEKSQLLSKKDEILPKPLETIDIYLKDGSTAKAKPTKKVFSDTLYRKYRVVLKENKALKDQMLGLELENAKLKIELRDFHTEDILNTQQSLQPPKDTNA